MGVRPSKNILLSPANASNYGPVEPFPRANLDETDSSDSAQPKGGVANNVARTVRPSKKPNRKKKDYANQFYASLQMQPYVLNDVEKDPEWNRSGSEEEADTKKTLVAESRDFTIKSCDLCDRLKLNNNLKSIVEAQIKVKQQQIENLKAQLKREEDALEQLINGPLAQYLATQDSILEQRDANRKPDPNPRSHFYRIHGPHYCTVASCETCGRIVSLSPYLIQLPKECYDLIYRHLVYPNIPSQCGGAFGIVDGGFSRLRMTCKSIYNKFLAWAPSSCDWKIRCSYRQSSDTSYSAFTTLTVELTPKKDGIYPNYLLVRMLISGPEYRRPVARSLNFYKQPPKDSRTTYISNYPCLDSLLTGKLAVVAVTENSYGFATTNADSFVVVCPIAQVYSYGGYDGSCVANDSIVYVALKDSEESREGERIAAIGEEKDKKVEEASEDDTSTAQGSGDSVRRSRFVCRQISELKEGDRLLSSFIGGVSDLDGNVVAFESTEERNTESVTAPIILRNVVTSEVRLVTRKTVDAVIPIVRIDDDFLITRGHPILREGEWTRPDEAWPVIESHVHELFNVYLEPHPTFVVGRNRWICGGLGGDYGRVALLHPENDAKFGRGFKMRFQAHLSALENESIESK